MSPSQNKPTSNSLPKEDTWSPRNLVNSRWAPGGLEDRVASTDGSAFGAQAFVAASRRARKDPAEIIQAGIDEAKKANEASTGANGPGSKTPSMTLMESGQNTITHKNDLPTKTPAIKNSNCTIGPLSEEEKKLKAANPLLDPTKHKGLSSSCWAGQ
ncbi:hypothetical protein KVR01_009911 [Diaporthe batatas]|uniref:uncharacterized protein n=1 Tax=Diaporthe batatas TaxID=748121 RepID=UPI001D0429C0|nr:uncharacterized protein KVR01_009911 [Diaporthe batatas]KAG8160375.1 hypothetical protein KVR01_009911 [Diaporthe batatas]